MSLRTDSRPALRASRFQHTVPLTADGPTPLDVFEELSGSAPRSGAILLEGADPERLEGNRSVIVPAPLVRLRARGRALAARALSRRGRALLPFLARRLTAAEGLRIDGDRLRARLPRAAPAPGSSAATERERLLHPSILDAARALVTLVDDLEARSNDALPIAVYGSFSYELIDAFEVLPGRAPDPDREADLNLVLGLDGIEIDPERGSATITTRSLGGPEEAREALKRLRSYAAALTSGRRRTVALDRSAGPERELTTREEPSPHEYARGVERVLEHIRCGDVFQTVLSRTLRVRSDAAPLDVYVALRRLNPSPYMFFFDLGDGALLGASPECCVKVQGREVRLRPIAGTVPRGTNERGEPDAELDARLGVELRLDPKEVAEHAMLVDLARNDLARVAKPGTREVREAFRVEAYSHVQHLVSTVVAELDAPYDALDAYRACANMGTLTGAPKLRAMELIRELEATSRGSYGGALGYLTREGNLDTCIVIRSLRFRAGTYTLRVGAGVVSASSPQRELEETRHKARAALRALELAEARA